MKKNCGWLSILALTFAFLSTQPTPPALAQPGPGGGPGGGPGMGRGWSGPGPDMMMGPWAMREGAFRSLCRPQGAGFVEWRLARIESVLRLTDAQKPKFEALRAASAKASEIFAKSCPDATPANPSARLEFMEKRAEGMLQAIRIVRPAFDGLYETLTDEQKARMSAQGPRGRRSR